jgi:hypothetical protein
MTIKTSRPYADVGDLFERRRWDPPPDFNAGEFRDRKVPSRWAAVHRSAKRPGFWQVSWFDAEGAIGDCERADLGVALRELPPGAWEYVS